jgi:hypothetical protein
MMMSIVDPMTGNVRFIQHGVKFTPIPEERLSVLDRGLRLAPSGSTTVNVAFYLFPRSKP